MSKLSGKAAIQEDNARYHWSRAMGIRLERERVYRDALARWGDTGPETSGCGRPHFPETVKDKLRFLAREHGKATQDAWDCLVSSRRSFSTRIRLRAEFEKRHNLPGYLTSYA